MLGSVILPVILVVLCYIVTVRNPPLPGDHVLTCPTPLKITPRDLNCPNNEVYHIVWNATSNEYIEGCFVPGPVSEGHETVLDSNTGKLNAVACREGTFQRHSYWSNTQCACNETKGHCNKTGQVVASNGSTTEDRTCRCQIRRGYKFSTKPSNECLCKSSSEDCTCVKKECETGTRLSPDYKCVSENLYFTTNYTCKDYITSEESTTESVPDSGISEMPTGMVQWYVTTILVICTALFCFALGVLLESKYGIYAPMCICCKKCRPGRNGSAPTNDEGTSTSKDSDPVQEIGSDAMEMSSFIKGDKSKDEQPSTADDCLDMV